MKPETIKRVSDLRAERGVLVEKMEALITGADDLTAEETVAFDEAAAAVDLLDARIARAERMQALSAARAAPVAGQETVPATVAQPVEKGSVLAGLTKAAIASGGNAYIARGWAMETYGESHPVTRALATSTGQAGGFIVPPDYMAEVIELLRPATVVRASGPRVVPMPRGAMTIPKLVAGATGSYQGENGTIAASQPSFGQVQASFKKLTVLVPVSNDMVRYANPAVDAIVRDDIVLSLARTEDKAFLRGDGTQGTPRGFRSFVSSGNTIASTASYGLTTVVQELGAAILKLKNANVPMIAPVWFMAPRTEEYLLNLQNSNGFFVFRDEMLRGVIRSYPYRTTTQIPTNLGSGADESEIYLVDTAQAMILDSMQLQLSVSLEGSYTDGSGASVSAFSNDQTIIRAIAEHDFQMRHDEAIALVAGVKWAPVGA
jgi:HK97 family phage major capsid protein